MLINYINRILSSLKLAILLMVFLIGFAIYGTIDYPSRANIFASTPFILTVLLFCLSIISCTFKRPFNLVHSGFILVHLSIICIAVGGIMTHLYAVSGSVVLHVGQTTDSFDTGEPTLFIFHQDSQQFLSIPLKQTKQVKQVKQVNQVKQKMLFYNDSIDFFGESANIRIMPYLNGSKAVSLFTLNKNNEDYKHVLGSTRQEGALLVTGSKTCEVFIDTRRVPLGFKLKLDRFRLEYYPGGQMAKNYFSDITINEQEKATISMNQPFSRNGYSLYQSSYQSTSHGQYISILTLSKTPGEWLVYLGYLLFILGLLNIFYLKPWLLQRHKTIPKELS